MLGFYRKRQTLSNSAQLLLTLLLKVGGSSNSGASTSARVLGANLHGEEEVLIADSKNLHRASLHPKGEHSFTGQS